ncbi:PepSY-associated TM helix domain-containing protein [Limnohabitans sp.]|jgi:uncharacterized iron-regulated membrane protein
MTSNSSAQFQARRRSLLWRLHFWSALIASPFVLVACLTGLLYVFTPQIERAWHGHLDTVQPQSQVRSLDDAVAAARQAAPEGWSLHSVIPAFEPDDSVRVAFTAPMPDKAQGGGHGGHSGHGAGAGAAQGKPQFLRPNFGIPARAVVVYVNPYTAEVLGQLKESERFATWARKLHSSLQQGDGWRWMIELAASWTMVMLVTGVYLWWPRPGQSGLPQSSAKGRVAWRQWHAFLGVALGLVSFVILTTGLTWSQNAGNQIKWARDATGQTPPRIPAQFKSTVTEGAKPLNWEQALQAIRREAPSVSMMVMAPKGPEGVWRANQMDRGDPSKRFDLLLDAYSGQKLYYSGWADQTAFGKATAIGIPFHRGEFGVWNQVLLFVFGAGILFSLVSGWVMFFKRRAAGSSIWPVVLPDAWRSVSPWAWLGGAFMLVAMPVLAISAVPVALAEAWMVWRKSRAAV